VFELSFPWALILLPLPFLIRLILPQYPVILPMALKVPFYSVLAKAMDKKSSSALSSPHILLPLLIWFLLVLALAGPRWVGEPQPVEQKGYNIMMVLDISGSMEMPDMAISGRPVSRLTVVKRAAEEFVKARLGDKIGLILFGTQAYLQTPLTYDRNNVLMRIEDASVGLAGKTTSIGDALGLAVKRLQATPPAGRVIILLTDGVNNSGVLIPTKAAEIAKQEDIKIYTIGLNSAQQNSNNIFFGFNSTAELDEDTLKEVANITGGQYFLATDVQSLEAIYARINELEKSENEQQTIRPQVDYYYWLLICALVLYLYWLTRLSGLKFSRKLKKFSEVLG
jgi:Ca-activated chloride channel family protein